MLICQQTANKVGKQEVRVKEYFYWYETRYSKY